MTTKSDLRLSASQVKNFIDCPRKWQLSRWLTVPSTPAQQLGTAVHKCHETGVYDQTTRAGVIAAMGAPYVPDECEKEKEFKLPSSVLGAEFLGYIDFFHEELRIIGDHKTTSNKKYALSSDLDLLSDVQAAVYYAAACCITGFYDWNLKWVYHLTRGTPRAWEATALATPYIMKPVIDGVRDIVKQMKLTPKLSMSKQLPLSSVDPLEIRPLIKDIPCNYASCNKYGGCSYIAICNPSPFEIGEQNPMAIDISKLRAAAAKAKQATEQQTEEQPEQQTEEQPEHTPGNRVRKTRKRKAKQATAPDASTTAEPQPTTAEPQPTERTLYIDCIPTDGCASASLTLLAIADNVAVANDLQHYRLAEYGKGPAMLCASVVEYYKEKPIPNELCICTGNQMESDALPALLRLYTRVVRSIK